MGIYAEDTERQFSWNKNGQTARQHQFGDVLDISH